MLTEDDRATPLGFFNLAEDYLEAAYVLGEHLRAGCFRGEVIKFVTFHAIELYLKAFLRKRGVSVVILERKFGHWFKKLIPACERHGLNFPDSTKGALLLAEGLRDPKETRYFRSTARPRIIPAGLFERALEIRNLVAPHFPSRLGGRPFENEAERS
jgi:hypothetical protein